MTAEFLQTLEEVLTEQQQQRHQHLLDLAELLATPEGVTDERTVSGQPQ